MRRRAQARTSDKLDPRTRLFARGPARALDGRLLRLVVERLALVDDVNGQEFDRFVAQHLERSMGHATCGYACRAGWNGHLLAVWRFDCAPLQEVIRLFPVMNV